MPVQKAGAGTLSNEKRYPAQITSAPVSTATANVGSSLRAASSSRPTGGRSATKYQSSAAAMAEGRNGSAENLDSTASPVAAPNSAAEAGAGRSSQINAPRSEAPVNAVSAMSVVASPACARTGGRNVKRNVAIAASSSPRYRRA